MLFHLLSIIYYINGIDSVLNGSQSIDSFNINIIKIWKEVAHMRALTFINPPEDEDHSTYGGL